MNSELEKKAGCVLRGRKVLIVEDDDELAGHIGALFKQVTGTDPAVVHTMQGAQAAMANARVAFDLVIMDVMLPESEAAYRKIKELESVLSAARDIIASYGPNPTSQDAQHKVACARQDRGQALARIRELITVDGGITLVREWRDNGARHAQIVPVLYLTAVGSGHSVAEGVQAAGSSGGWLVKPVSSEELLAKVIELLAQKPQSETDAYAGRGL